MKLEVDGMNEARNATSVICSAYDSFFEAEKKIADFLIEHKAEAAGMTVGELARASQTSDATVSRFCRRCGQKKKESYTSYAVRFFTGKNTVP